MDDDMDIAIVGLACRFPGARDAAEFWRKSCGRRRIDHDTFR